jgi:hypothetical protein
MILGFQRERERERFFRLMSTKANVVLPSSPINYRPGTMLARETRFPSDG